MGEAMDGKTHRGMCGLQVAQGMTLTVALTAMCSRPVEDTKIFTQMDTKGQADEKSLIYR